MTKRVKRVHISGWLEIFLSDPIMGRIAHYLETPALFRFLLGVSKELRNKALKTTRWNQVMEYVTRLKRDLRIPWTYTEKQNVLTKFLKRLYRKNICSICFQYKNIRARPGYGGLNMCWDCAGRKNLIITEIDLVHMFLTDQHTFLEVPWGHIWQCDLPSFVVKTHEPTDTCFDNTTTLADWDLVRCRDFSGNVRFARIAKTK